MTSRVAVLGAVLLAGTSMAPAHEPEFTAEQVAALRACARRMEKIVASRGLTVEDAWEFDFGNITPHDLEHVSDGALGVEVAADVREALRHVCRTASFRRGPLGRLEKARDICYLLGSASNADWLRAYRLLRREPFTEDLDRAVIALGRDRRAEIRLIAAELAGALVVFGREAEGLSATVLACLTDEDPDVAAACAMWVPEEVQDKRLVDRMVACVADDRALERVDSPLWLAGWRTKTVKDVLAYRLSWMSCKERHGRWKARPPFDGRPEYVALSVDEIRAWWKDNRPSFGFGTPAPQWRVVLDRVVVLDVGRPVVLHGEGGIPFNVRLGAYREVWRGTEPVTIIKADVHSHVDSEEVYVADLGGETSDLGGVLGRSRGTFSWADGAGIVCGEVFCRWAFLPTNENGRVRMKLTLHFGHEQRN